jgi:molybdopterin-guanine dinucleotide biosynthesis protein A
VRVVYDLHPGAGPLAGIEAGLAGCTTGVLFALACDMPLVTARMAKFVIEASEGHQAAVPVIGGRPEPVCAAYRLEAAAGIAAALGRGIRRAAEALGELEARYLREEELAAQGHPAELFWNINTPADYQAFLARRHNLPG